MYDFPCKSNGTHAATCILRSRDGERLLLGEGAECEGGLIVSQELSRAIAENEHILEIAVCEEAFNFISAELKRAHRKW